MRIWFRFEKIPIHCVILQSLRPVFKFERMIANTQKNYKFTLKDKIKFAFFQISNYARSSLSNVMHIRKCKYYKRWGNHLSRGAVALRQVDLNG